MRVTEKLKFLSSHANINRLRSEQQKKMMQLSSGRRVNQLSDDALAAKKISEFQKESAKLSQFQRNIDYARHPLEVADSSLGDGGQLLNRLKEILIQGLQSTLTQEDRDHLANEVLVIRDELRELSNTRVNGQFLFGGFADQNPPYDNTFTFVGDTNFREIQITENLRAKSAIRGGRAFGDGTAGTVDVFDNIAQMEVAIRGDLEVNMQTELGRLEAGIEQVISTRNEIGIHIARLNTAQRMVTFHQDRHTIMTSEQRDIDFTEAVSEMQMLDNALQVALSTSGKMMQRGSLLDFI